jgi:hypothetical protein
MGETYRDGALPAWRDDRAALLEHRQNGTIFYFIINLL